LDVFTCAGMGRILNRIFGTNVSKEEWTEAMGAKDRTLGELCTFIATRARTIDLRPVTVLGHPSRAAGAFLAVRELLRKTGADVSDLRPSSSLQLYLRRRPSEFVIKVASLAPGTLPCAQA